MTRVRGGRSGFASRFIFALGLLTGALLMASIDRGVVISCSRPSPKEPCSCEVETNIAGVYTLYVDQIPSVESIVAETKIIENQDSKTKKVSKAEYEHLLIKGDRRTVATELMSRPLGSRSKDIEEKFSRFLSSSELEFRAWQIETAWLMMALVLGFLAIIFLWSAFRRLFAAR